MIELQVLNKILSTSNDSIITKYNITDDYFTEYKEEWKFIKNHKLNYGNIPDIETFLVEFEDFEVIKVNESDEYLAKTFEEEHLYEIATPILKEVDKLYQQNSYEAVRYLQANIPNLELKSFVTGVDIISEAQSRLDEYLEVKADSDSKFIPSGFEELDEIIGGFHTGEELVVLFARTNQGKSWVLLKMVNHAWKMKKRVGLLEPEMSANRIGYRFDTWENNVSNSKLVRGEDVEDYEEYIQNLKQSKVPLFVVHPKDFQRKVTVSKLKHFVESNKLDMLAIDGISYLKDERKEHGDNKTIQLTNISEDLMELSIELGIPVIVVTQSNREGTLTEDLELTNIRDSDGIAYNASIVIAVQQKNNELHLSLKKSRNSSVNAKLTYLWNIDEGRLDYIPSNSGGINDAQKSEELRRQYNDVDEEF